MRLALVISTLGRGGAERVISLLANHWAARGDDVTLVTLEKSEDDSYELHPRIRRMALGLMKESPGMVSAVVNNVSRVFALRRALSSTGAAAVLSFGEQTNVLTLWAARGLSLRRVVSERTDPARHPIGRSWSLLRRMSYPFADALVVQTPALAGWGARMVGAQRTHVIANPVRDMRRFAGPQARERLVVAVGRLGPEKGFDVLLTAFAAIAAEFPNWSVLIVGEGTERAALSNLAKSLGITDRVSMPGSMPEPGEVLARAGLFVSSSRYEGFPNALLEAMAAGVPVISTDCTGAREIVTDGHDGLLVPVESPSALSAALSRLMRDDALRIVLANNARAVADRYSIDKVAERWDDVLAGPAAGLNLRRLAADR